MTIYDKHLIDKIKNLISEIKGIEYHNKLNPNLWDDLSLKKEVRDKLIKSSELFFDYLKIDWVNISDIVLTGSSANYNYTEYSDIDLHLVIDYEKIHKNCPLVDEFLDAKKSLFNKKHNIHIKGQPLEMYVEDVSDPAISSGIYSVMKNKWIKKPEHKQININDRAIIAKFKHTVSLIDSIISGSGNIEESEHILNKIYKMRSSGLEKTGEFSVENLVFKLLRNNDYIKRLKDYITTQQDRDISI